ncbi:hypothetical protein F5B22DRAFT_648135 [Xylaria bambusicola]|uniref:uncharacterized protein n=1 Tax=Xylaria bambusicola TaxID=326684 RepID=UPI002008ABFC|nr:uncharacterized protein F5B22DRAFT_648135 [Xylaria bambusicola]KAI0513041.1 hypothetical protein F5B22DRAFT_648135 [Xylaria bambusicola]
MRWLMDRFFLTSEDSSASVPVPVPDQDTRTFHRFSDLPAELRLQIWEYYFDIPRIHVLYPAPSKLQSTSNGAAIAYADLTAQTNHNVPTSLRFAAATINSEALEVFHKKLDLVHMNFMGLPSKHVKDLYEHRFGDLVDRKDREQALSVPKDILQSTPELAEFVRNPGGKPRDTLIPGVHVNWANDLLYLTDGADVNCETLRRVCNGPIASKLRRVAILIHDSYKYEGFRQFLGPSVDFPKPSANLDEVVLVVRLSDLDPWVCANAKRDDFGFVPYDSVIQDRQKGSWEWMQNMKLIERRFVYVAQLLREAFPDLEDRKIKWAVDIDYIHRRAETKYMRTIR